MIRAIVSAILVLLASDAGKAAHHAVATKENAASRAAIPLPRARPPFPTIAKPQSAPSTSETRAPPASGEPSSCLAGLVPARAVAEPQNPIIGPGLCGASDLVRLKAIRLIDGRFVALHPPAQVRCALAEALTYWVRGDVARAVEMIGGQLAGLGISTSYDCRPRNGVMGAKLSEHATGNAIDLDELTLTNGKNLVLTDTSVDNDLRAELARSACQRFTTVLGPGSDEYHENNIHLDLLQRRGGYRICQWEVR
jgi:hypothetical protein